MNSPPAPDSGGQSIAELPVAWQSLLEVVSLTVVEFVGSVRTRAKDIDAEVLAFHALPVPHDDHELGRRQLMALCLTSRWNHYFIEENMLQFAEKLETFGIYLQTLERLLNLPKP